MVRMSGGSSTRGDRITHIAFTITVYRAYSAAMVVSCIINTFKVLQFSLCIKNNRILFQNCIISQRHSVKFAQKFT